MRGPRAEAGDRPTARLMGSRPAPAQSQCAPGPRGWREPASQTSPHRSEPPRRASPPRPPERSGHICQAGSYLHLSGACLCFQTMRLPSSIPPRGTARHLSKSHLLRAAGAGRELASVSGAGHSMDPLARPPICRPPRPSRGPASQVLDTHSLALAQHLSVPTARSRQGSPLSSSRGARGPHQAPFPDEAAEALRLQGHPPRPVPITGPKAQDTAGGPPPPSSAPCGGGERQVLPRWLQV